LARAFPQTKQALLQFQRENGLEPTAALDANATAKTFGKNNDPSLIEPIAAAG